MTAPFRRALASDYFVLGLSGLYAVLVAPFTPGFLSGGNWGNILSTLLPLLIVALGQMVVMVTGGIDLSATAVIGLSSITGAMVMTGGDGALGHGLLATGAGVAVMLGTGTLVGTLNGVAVVAGRMPPFMVTLASMMGLGGLAVWLTHSKSINGLPAGFLALGGRTTAALVIATGVALAIHVMLTRSMYGRWLYAIGHNSRAALVSGVPVGGVRIAAYVVSGFCAALASVLYTGQAETGSPVLGQRLLLDVIGATVIGGTSLFGGRGKVLWTLFGVLFLKLVDNSLNLLNLSLFSITMAKGAVILLAACLDALRARLVSQPG